MYRGTDHGKRVQSNMGAKNHATVLPDASKERTLDALAGAVFGASGMYPSFTKLGVH
jgi:malonate-semialdehyde dehydrogenase (acetylating) / methylmalonate-semialdehyde dehydrogenase